MQGSGDEEEINYQKIQKICYILGLELTFEILFYLKDTPLRYYAIKDYLKCNDAILSRRLNELKEIGLIAQSESVVKNRKVYHYVLTMKGLDVVNFFEECF